MFSEEYDIIAQLQNMMSDAYKKDGIIAMCMTPY